MSADTASGWACTLALLAFVAAFIFVVRRAERHGVRPPGVAVVLAVLGAVFALASALAGTVSG